MVDSFALAINAEAVRVVNTQIKEVKREAIRDALKRGRLSVDEIAKNNGVLTSFVEHIQRELLSRTEETAYYSSTLYCRNHIECIENKKMSNT